ncbi:MAG: PAC2 family protein, partial [Chloroflexi bacterium]|nr:PAC2 family protein [Chloroflexota bacterium]
MDSLIFYKKPRRKFRTLVAAFAGWPDASEAATRAVEYLVSMLPARRMAEIDPEEFYDFSIVRPVTRINNNGDRSIKWPENVFYHSASRGKASSTMLLIGVEPSLKWRAYTELVMSVVERFGVEKVVSLGSLLDAVPHTRQVKLTGVATTQAAREELAKLGMLDSGYQGPSAIHTALMEACTKKNIQHISLWGHCPHYVNT